MTVIAAAAMLLAGTAANAQGWGGQGGPEGFDPARMAQMRVDFMKESLKLTDAQCTKLKDLFQKESEEMQKTMQKAMESGERPSMEGMRERMEKQNAEIKKILTPEQFKTYTDQMNRMRQGGPGGPGPR